LGNLLFLQKTVSEGGGEHVWTNPCLPSIYILRGGGSHTQIYNIYIYIYMMPKCVGMEPTYRQWAKGKVNAFPPVTLCLRCNVFPHPSKLTRIVDLGISWVMYTYVSSGKPRQIIFWWVGESCRIKFPWFPYVWFLHDHNS
jgi:hypothetical protein